MAALQTGSRFRCAGWMRSLFEDDSDLAAKLEPLHAILVPGGFGERGSEGKIGSVKFARERDVPFFGICLGMQMACIEAARNMAGIPAASTTEFGETSEPVVGLITEWMTEEGLQKREAGGDLGGTMRLGAYDAVLQQGSRISEIYGEREISERHRHRYEVNKSYVESLENRSDFCWHVTGRRIAGNGGKTRSQLVCRRSVSSRTEKQAV